MKKCFEKVDIVSIIVAVFNTESYLEKCLLSIVKQSFTDIEINGEQRTAIKLIVEPR